jgi:hypothetical protein
MKNTLEIKTIDGLVHTFIVTSDGVTAMEVHREWLDDEKVLELLVKKKFYQKFKGSWQITFPQEHKTFFDSNFDNVVSSALHYIFERDNPSFSDDYIG